MSTTEPASLKRAGEIIERFGGIRPMANKIGIPVTTIQGWKKRDIIPGSRRTNLIEAAQKNNIEILDLLEDKSPASQNADEQTSEKQKNQKSPVQLEKDIDTLSGREILKPTPADFTQIAIETEKKAVTKGAIISCFIVLLGLSAIVALFWPSFKKVDQQGERLSVAEGNIDRLADDVADVKQQQSLFKGLVPEDWSQRLETLKQQASETVEQARETSQEIIENPDIQNHLTELESYVQDLTTSNNATGLLARLQNLQTTMPGRELLDQATAEIALLFSGINTDKETIEDELDTARTKSNTLEQVFEDVPRQDLEAASMLLALTQLRASLNRDKEPFNQDLELLMGMVEEDNIELRTALERLAPYAEQGILTPNGLSQEFKGLAGDVVISSLQGEDVSISEKARARMNELFQVEKNGELLTGTETQFVIKKAQNYLDRGDVQGAINVLEALDQKQSDPLKGWLEKAQATVNANNLKDLIEQAIEITSGTGLLGGSQILKDDTPGLRIIKR